MTWLRPLIFLPLLAGCGAKPTEDSGGLRLGPLPDAYDFDSRFESGSSVAYTGQTLRQVLIRDLKTHMGGLTDRVDSGWFPEQGDITEELDFYFSFDGEIAGSVPLAIPTSPAPLQATYGEISTSANLVGKLAGNDEVGQHKDWNQGFVGWEDPAVTSPESLVGLWFAQIDGQVVERSNGILPLDPTGAPIASVLVTAQGQDLQQLTEKFLHGAISFSQASDDYLDDDVDGKGLLSSHATPEDGAVYSALEHGWDEGFGYFGASRNYGSWTDAQIDDPGYADDWEADGAIDLNTELCFGASSNAAKRDAGAVAATDFTADAWEGFLSGRQLLASTKGELDGDQLAQLQGHRDRAIGAWEKALAATVVHYLNEVLVDMGTFGTPDYAFADHAKHWSEGKGFALAFQFNPRSPMSESDFATLHELLGQAPVLPDADAPEVAAYRSDLIAARALLGETYGFEAANLGSDEGTGGW